MSVRDVAKLREEGKLNEALALARRELDEDPNEWTRMSLFWVLRDLAMNWFVPANNMEQARYCLNLMEKLLPGMMDADGTGERAFQNLYKLILPNASEVKKISEMSKTNPNEAYQKITELFGADAKHLDHKLHEDFGWILYRYMKANSNQLTSNQIHRLLNGYIQLQNERPSLLHSTILNYALNFSKDHPDFSLYKFFFLWRVKNLRYEDYQDEWADGHEIPSLISRICKAIIDSNETFDVSDFVSQFDKQDIIIEDLRQAYFWRLMNLQEENKTEELIDEFTNYAEHYSVLGPSYWHSEILKIANKFMVGKDSSNFLPFIIKWEGLGNFRDEDWVKGTNDDGKVLPSLAANSAQKCLSIIFKASRTNNIPNTTLVWLKELCKKIKNLDHYDEWNARLYAAVCVLCGEVEEAINIYKFLLLHMGEKYFLWVKLANLISNDDDLCIGLLLKSKEIGENEDVLGDIHLNLASLWQKKGYGTIANKELEAYISHRKEKGWSISKTYRDLVKNTVSELDTSTQVDFNAYIEKAEDFIYRDFDPVNFVITVKWVSNDVEYCNLFDGKETNLCVKTKRFPILKQAEIGDIIQIRCNIVEEKQADTSTLEHRNITVKKTIPLMAKKTDMEPWSILPIKYGVIDYVNENKKILHIITQNSKQTFNVYEGTPLAVDSFVKFREYEFERKGETRIYIIKMEPCSSEEALQFMPNQIAVVDDINTTKKLFHVVLGPGKISDVIRFDQTDIRPEIGDFLRISYCIKKNKEGQKRIKFLDIQTSDVGIEGVKSTVTGRLELKYNSGYYEYDEEPDFAFIKGFYVHHSILRKYNITHDCDASAKLVLGGDDNWKVYDLELS